MVHYIFIRLDYFYVQTEKPCHPLQPGLAELPSCPPVQLCFSLSSSGSWPRYILGSRQQFFFPIAYFLPGRPGCPSPLSIHHHISELYLLSQHCPLKLLLRGSLPAPGTVTSQHRLLAGWLITPGRSCGSLC